MDSDSENRGRPIRKRKNVTISYENDNSDVSYDDSGDEDFNPKDSYTYESEDTPEKIKRPVRSILKDGGNRILHQGIIQEFDNIIQNHILEILQDCTHNRILTPLII